MVDRRDHLDDEALNAVLDGEAGRDEATHASSCPACTARLARFREVAVAVAAPVAPPDPARRRAAVNAAVDAAVDGAGGDLASVRPLRPRRWRVSPGWAAAAAVVATGALAVPLVDRLTGTGARQDLATVAEDAETGAGSGAGGAVAGAPGGPGGPGGAGGETAPARDDPLGSLPDLGEIDLSNLDELAVSLGTEARQEEPTTLSAGPDREARLDEQEGPAPGAAAAPPAPPPPPCVAPARQRDPALGPLTAAAQGTVDGRPVVVLAFGVPTPDAAPGARLVVLAAEGCVQLGTSSP